VASLKAWYIYIKVAVGAPLKARYFTYTLQLLFGALLRARHLHITIAVGSLFDSKEFYITVDVWGPFDSKVLTHYNCSLGPL